MIVIKKPMNITIKGKMQQSNGVDEFYLLLSSSQELSFKCWDNFVITPTHC
jgi:hypothetical protein